MAVRRTAFAATFALVWLIFVGGAVGHPAADVRVLRQAEVVEWFGRETPFPAGPGVLAQRTGALVIPGFCERTGRGRFHCTAHS